jgi:PAS domain S-box-containing protein
MDPDQSAPERAVAPPDVAVQPCAPSGEVLAALAGHAALMAWTWDADGLVDAVGGATLAFTGRAGADLLGQGWLELVHPLDRSRFVDACHNGLRDRRPWEVEARLLRRDGAYRWLLISGGPRHASNGSFAGLVAVGLDITERHQREELNRQAEQELRAAAEQARAQAEAANRTTDEFLATLSHELRTPLNAIVGWVHLLRTGRLDERTTRRALETIDRNARIQTQIIADILDVSRIISGKLHVRMRAVEMAAVAEAALEALRLTAQAKAIRVGVALDPRAGPVLGDADRLQQIVWNLLSNAIKFTPDGGEVKVALRRSGADALLSVSDNGVGIAPEFLPFVFDRFRQADASPTRQQGGLGLGLAIARHLAEMHAGAILAESPGTGRGAVFTLRLPLLAEDRPSDEPRPTAVPAPAAPGPSLEGVSVLVVCGDGGVAEATAGALRERGADVVLAARAEQAVDIVRRTRPHVLLACASTPGDEDQRLIRAVRDIPPERGGLTPAALVNGRASFEDRVNSLLAGYQAHVPGHVEAGELATVVASLAGRTREFLG